MITPEVDQPRTLLIGETESPYERITVDGMSLGLDDFYELSMESAYFDLLKDQPLRFSDFAWEDTEKFIEFLGPDVNPTQHGLYQARTITMPMLDRQVDLVPVVEDRSLLAAYMVIHDHHEGVVGDMPPYMKTEEQAEFETGQMDHFILSSTPRFMRPQLLAMSRVCESGHLLSGEIDIWKVQENLGYFLTALQAGFLALTSRDLTEDERTDSWGLALDPTRQDRSRGLMEEARGHVTFVDDVLIRNSNLIRAIEAERGRR